MQDDGPFYYAPLDVQQTRPSYLLVRVSGDTRTPARSIGEIVRGVDPQMAVTVDTLASIVERKASTDEAGDDVRRGRWDSSPCCSR